MRHLTVLLVTGLLAGTASASSIPVSDLDLVITGTNLDLALIGGGIDTDLGPSVGIIFTGGQGPFSASVTLTSYLTISGGTGTGTASYLGSLSSGCNANPITFIAGCSRSFLLPNIFTFGVPVTIVERVSLAINNSGFGSAQIGISQPFISVQDSFGNQVNAAFAYSATADPVATVSNPEPGTWALLTGAGAMLLWLKRKKSGASGKRCPARALSA